ncbi:transposase family protein [Corynebacterium matruchotii]|uniref:transposase family protein n=1 Tax=Corynebacterium matruchotii TaxID=43768 RepID=UPI003C6ED94C
MHNNKILYQPRTADPSTLTTDNLLTTSNIPHHHPPSLGVLTNVQITMLYLQENIRQQALAGIFGTSQPTISRAINNVLNILDVVLPPPPQPVDLNPNRLYVLDGTLVPCWWWKNARNLYSGKHHRAGHNLQVLTDQAGEIFYISEPLPG